MRLSQRIERLRPSATVELNGKIADLQRQGLRIIALNVGEPDFPTPENIIQAGHRALDSGFTKYTPAAGIYELREAICDKLSRENGLSYTPDDILVSTGAKQALFNAFLTICDRGDEVLLPTPCYVSFIEMIKLAESTPVLVPTDESNGFQPDPEAIARAITPKTRAIIINTPNNPTGAVYNRKSLQNLAELAEKYDFYIIVDEIYEKLVYAGAEHVSIGSISPEVQQRTVTINGFSKSYAMTGWRIGYAAGPQAIIRGMRALQGHTTTTTNAIAQIAALEALRGPQAVVETMREKYDERRQFLLKQLQALPGISCPDVKGAFYLLPNVTRLFGKKYAGSMLQNSLDAANFFLDVAKVALVPGTAFEAPACLRISYSYALETIQEAMQRMKKAIDKLV